MYIFEALCALAVAFLCPDVEAYRSAIGVGFKLYSRPIKEAEVLLFKVDCYSPSCKIDQIYLEKQTGPLLISAKSETTDICTDEAFQCTAKNIPENQFFVYLKPNPSFVDGSLHVKLGQNQKGMVTEINHEGGYTMMKDTIQIKSGYQTTNFPTLFKQYKVECNGNCKNIKFYSRTREPVLLAAAKEPVLVKKGGCHNCICISEKNHGNKPLCKHNDKGTFSLTSSTFYVTMIPNDKTTNVKALIEGNVKRMEEYLIGFDGWEPYVDKDNYQMLVYPFRGPVTTQKEVVIFVLCAPQCKNVKIEIKTDLSVKGLYAGKDTTFNAAGVCTDCDCHNTQTCKTRFNPKLLDQQGNKYFEVKVIMETTNSDYPAYVRISGEQLLSVLEHSENGN